MGDSLGTYVQHVGGAGLVYNVTEYLFGHGINIENLETHTEEVLASLHFQHLSSNMWHLFTFQISGHSQLSYINLFLHLHQRV